MVLRPGHHGCFLTSFWGKIFSTYLKVTKQKERIKFNIVSVNLVGIIKFEKKNNQLFKNQLSWLNFDNFFERNIVVFCINQNTLP